MSALSSSLEALASDCLDARRTFAPDLDGPRLPAFLSSSLQAFSISIHTKVAEQVFAFVASQHETHSRSRAFANSQRDA